MLSGIDGAFVKISTYNCCMFCSIAEILKTFCQQRLPQNNHCSKKLHFPRKRSLLPHEYRPLQMSPSFLVNYPVSLANVPFVPSCPVHFSQKRPHAAFHISVMSTERKRKKAALLAILDDTGDGPAMRKNC